VITMVMTSTSTSVEADFVTYRQESSFKGRHRHFCDRYRTLFYINVHFKWYIFRFKVPFKVPFFENNIFSIYMLF